VLERMERKLIGLTYKDNDKFSSPFWYTPSFILDHKSAIKQEYDCILNLVHKSKELKEKITHEIQNALPGQTPATRNKYRMFVSFFIFLPLFYFYK
jgi:hypothetical protein